MKLFARIFIALFLCQTLAHPAQAITSTAFYKQNDHVAHVIPAQPAIESIVNRNQVNATLQGSNAQAGNNLNITAANIAIEAAKDSSHIDQQGITQNGYVRAASSDETLVGANFNAGNNLTLNAGTEENKGKDPENKAPENKDSGHITLSAAQLNAQSGKTTLTASGSITLQTASTRHSTALQDYASSSSLLSSKSSALDQTQTSTVATGASVQGNTVLISAGQNIKLQGSNVVSDLDTTLLAKRDIHIEAASSNLGGSHYAQKSESGLLSGGGLGITIGHRDQSLDQQNTATQAQASTVGSLQGNVTAVAGNSYTQRGSDVLSPAGDITVLAKDIKILDARETANSQTEQKFSQSGLTLALTGPVIDTLQTTQQMMQAASNTRDSRMKALAAANIALSTQGAANKIAENTANGVSNVGISITLGSSSSKSNSANTSDSARGSSLNAGGNVDLIASGAGQDSHILIQGSEVKAGQNATLNADGQVNLLAAQNTAKQTSSNSSSSASVGVAVTFGPKGAAAGFTASASAARGNADGADQIASNSHVTAGHTANIKSGGDTTLQGAVIAANTVKTDVGGKLNIESTQDTSQFDAKQSSAGAGVSLCIPPLCR